MCSCPENRQRRAGAGARLSRLPRRDTNRLSGVWVCGCVSVLVSEVEGAVPIQTARW